MSRWGKYRGRHGRKGDFYLILFSFALALIGLIMISSASVVVAYDQFGSNTYFVGKQGVAFIIGAIFFTIMALTNYRFWIKNAKTLMAITLILLIVIFIPGIGTNIGGASRWIDLGPIFLQPSEMAKLVIIIYLATWLVKRQDKITSLREGVIPFIVMISVVLILVMKQPDMGTVITLVVIAGGMFFVAGASGTHILSSIIVASGAFLILARSAPYRWQRVTTFLNPGADTLGAGYQISQALLAIGSGGWWGLGFGQSRQKYLYLPQSYTDAIFAVMVEELGFIRIMLILFLIIGLVWRILRVAHLSKDPGAKFIASGVAIWIAGQAIINIGAILGLLPLTGIPLPLISYGGSSLVFLFGGLGLVYSISKEIPQ